MARIINNPLGDLSGKAGSVVFKKTKYGTYISSLPNVNSQKSSTLQKKQQSKMKTVMHFLTPLQWILKNTYFPLQQNSPTFNHIKSYYLRHALTSNGEGYHITYSQCLLSYGDLRIPEQVELQREESQVHLTWQPQVEQAMAKADDQLFVVVYQPDLHQFYFVEQLAERQAGQATFAIPEVWSPTAEFHGWVGYYRPQEQQASLSVYLGEL
ncbi:DUF6266 family protein [Mesonia maritima]|uniref:Uncharacterized protein n=1 Tax=Mesonia maritima TaxID=1793873 RepID=A0ABU1K869_9FLAO|nr:DUF6266 family protein [Mesonia maritima]MDR6300677.1 hypothetical protein [Mesonia maritima]